MKLIIRQCVTISLVSIVLTSGIYTGLVWCIAYATPHQGQAERVYHRGALYYAAIAQYTNRDDYFSVRPSAVQYNATGSGGSNNAVCSPEYRKVIEARVDSFLIHNVDVRRDEIPLELLSASGSGLDPDVSIESALVQVKRIARLRHVNEQELEQLVRSKTERAFLGLFGPSKVNILALNIALDSVSTITSQP